MTAATRDLYIEQGATFRMGFTWHDVDPETSEAGSPVDLTGATARMQIRAKQKSPILLDASSQGDSPKIALGGATGRVDITFSDEDTDKLTSRTAVYDLEIQRADGTVVRLLQGAVTVSPNVTQTDEDPEVA